MNSCSDCIYVESCVKKYERDYLICYKFEEASCDKCLHFNFETGERSCIKEITLGRNTDELGCGFKWRTE